MYEDLAQRYEMEATFEAFRGGTKSCTQELAELERIGRQANDILSRHLTDQEKNALTAVIELTAHMTASEGVTLDQLKGRLAGLAQEELLATVGSLWKQAVLIVRVSL